MAWIFVLLMHLMRTCHYYEYNKHKKAYLIFFVVFFVKNLLTLFMIYDIDHEGLHHDHINNIFAAIRDENIWPTRYWQASKIWLLCAIQMYH